VSRRHAWGHAPLGVACVRVVVSRQVIAPMSVQYFLQGKILGIEQFLLSGDGGAGDGSGERVLAGRSHWVTLLSEVLPRALLAELGLAKILLGSSGGGQFLVVIPTEVVPQAGEFLAAADRQVQEMSAGHLKLVWAGTENLGDWSDVRKRLTENMNRQRSALLSGEPNGAFAPFAAPDTAAYDGYFAEEMFRRLRDASSVGWSPENPARVEIDGGKHKWSLGPGFDDIPLARHVAMDDDGQIPATPAMLAERAEGRQVWGVLRGDVDNFGIRLRRAQTIEEHIQLSVIFKRWFAGELQAASVMPDYWRKVTVLYSGGDDFAVYGSWDSLIAMAREMERLFHLLAEATLKEFPGPEGKTITMALALAPHAGASLASVFEDAGQKLEIAKCAAKDGFYLLGRTLEWKVVGDAAEMKEIMARMVNEFGVSPQFLGEIGFFYRDSNRMTVRTGRSRTDRFDKPWRFQRRLNRVLGTTRDRELQKLRNSLMNEFVGKNMAQVKLRPSGRVALEWATLLTEA